MTYLRAQTELSDVSMHGYIGFMLLFDVVAFPEGLVAEKYRSQFTWIFSVANVAKQT